MKVVVDKELVLATVTMPTELPTLAVAAAVWEVIPERIKLVDLV